MKIKKSHLSKRKEFFGQTQENMIYVFILKFGENF